ncbi:MAG: PAS domain S-box protein [Candidatus Coatesbacteria bacterium]|nr:PAS domain S-box protein [Candidatus Coatesbacteria bacterium]
MNYRTLFEASADGILVADAESRKFIYANRSICDMLGFKREELAAMSIGDIHPQDSLARIVSEFDAQARGEMTLAEDIPCLRKDGTLVYADINSRAVDIDGRQCVVGFFRDITERKFLQGELTRAQKLESVGQLAAGIAHEINTPAQYVGDNISFLKDAFGDLMELLGAYGALLSSAKEGSIEEDLIRRAASLAERMDIDFVSEEIPRALEEAQDGIGRISKIVLAMKQFAHPGSEEKVPTDINEAVRTTVTVSSSEWKYVADIALDLDENLSQVECLPAELNQVLLNIIVNAAHAVEQVVGDGSNGKGKIKVSTRSAEDWAEIRICDTGTGMPANVKERIFDPFFTTKEVGRGTGQGLAIAHAVIVEKHGGTLTVDSEVGKGTLFTIRLPLVAQQKEGGSY